MAAQFLSIRGAELDDCEAMGFLHVRAWQHAYAGVMPDEFLSSLDANERVEMWRAIVEDGQQPVIVAVLGDVVVGHATYGAADAPDDGPEQIGEVISINIEPRCWGRGIGRALLRQATESLRALNFSEAVLWVVSANKRARLLYESESWSADGASTSESFGGLAVDLIRYRTTLESRAGLSK